MVYVQPPAAPAASNNGTVAAETLTIDEPAPVVPPAPQAPAAATTTSTATNQPVARKQPKSRNENRGPESPAPDAAPATDAVQAPSLEPAEQASSENEVRALQEGLRRRIDGIQNGSSTSTDRQTLEDARSFVSQSEGALKVHDLLKAKELAEKARLLLDALGRRP